jgi:hypothetical protein
MDASSYDTKVGVSQGGDTLFVKNGGTVDLQTGAVVAVNGVDKTAVIVNGPQMLTAAALAASKKVAYGQATTVAAVDTIATGIGTLEIVLATLDSDPTDDPEWVTASIGDQAGSPVAGSFLLKSWKNTGGSDPTPVAATTFGKKVNWIAIGH